MALARSPKPKDNATYRDHRAALDAAVAALPRAVAVVGDEPFLRREALSVLAAAFAARYPAAEELVLYGPSTGGGGDTLKGAVMELGGPGLFAREKVVVFRQADRALFPAAGGDGEKEAKPAREASADPEVRFLAALAKPDPGLWCWLELSSLPRNRKFGKALAETVTLIPCPPLKYPRDQEAWLRDHVRKLGKTLEPEAAELLLSVHGGRPGALAAELEKLAVHAGDGTAVTAEAARLFFAGSRELDVFGLTNAVEARDFPSALDFARRIGEQGLRDERGKLADGRNSAHETIQRLASTLEALFTARVFHDRREECSAFQSAAGLSPYRAERLWRAARNYSPAELRRALERCAQAAHSVNDTGGDPLYALETAVVAIVR